MPATMNPMDLLTSKLSAPDTSSQLVGMRFLPSLIGLVQDLYDVLDRRAAPPFPQARLQLNYASGIGADNHIRAGFVGGLGLFGHETARQLWLGDVVDAGAAAAAVAVFHLHQPQAGDGSQESARLLANPLPVRQVAGILVGDGSIELAKAAVEIDAGQELGHIL